MADIDLRRQSVANAIREINERLDGLLSKSKEDDKRVQFLESQLATLRQISANLERSSLPERPDDARVEISAPTQATIEFRMPSAAADDCLVLKYKG